MDGLTTILPEIKGVVSSENRRHVDPWLQQVLWVEQERTLVLYILSPAGSLTDSKDVGIEPASWDRDKVLATLSQPSLLKIYFPIGLEDKPFCFCEDDNLVPATEAANERFRPLSYNSVLAVVTTALQCVKRKAASTSARQRLSGRPLANGSGGRAGGIARGWLAAAAVLAAIKEDPLGADLVLALLSLAVSSYRRDTVSTPFPKQLESASLMRAYPAFISCLEDIPSMLEISTWTDAGQLLRLPPLSLLVLHFVLVTLPAKLRAQRRTNMSSEAMPACNGGSTAAAAAVSGGGGGGGGGGTAAASSFPGDGGDGGISGPLAPLPEAGGPDSAVSNRRPGGGGGGGGGGAGGDVGGGGGGGGGVGTQLGDVPSFVFDAVLPDDPAFYAEAKLVGSTVAYHGSSPENFHSIVNTGLRVMSGTRRMKNGAAFGEGIYLSGSQNAAATFACRGDGSGTTVWPRSVFGDDASSVAVAGGGVGSRTRHKKFQHRLVAKCRILKGDGVKEIEGWGDEASYFVVSDESRVRVEKLLLFHESQPSEQQQQQQRATSNRTVDRTGPSAPTTSRSSGGVRQDGARKGKSGGKSRKRKKGKAGGAGKRGGLSRAGGGSSPAPYDSDDWGDYLGTDARSYSCECFCLMFCLVAAASVYVVAEYAPF